MVYKVVDPLNVENVASYFYCLFSAAYVIRLFCAVFKHMTKTSLLTIVCTPFKGMKRLQKRRLDLIIFWSIDCQNISKHISFIWNLRFLLLPQRSSHKGQRQSTIGFTNQIHDVNQKGKKNKILWREGFLSLGTVWLKQNSVLPGSFSVQGADCLENKH